MITFISTFLAVSLFTGSIDSRTEDLKLVVPVVEEAEVSNHLPGVGLAAGMSQITGVAISPLLGVSTVGAWTYFRADEIQRALLPWYCHPAAWGIGISILLLCFFKDTIGAGAPPFLKKPLDLVELFENKASAAVASAAFVPLIANQIAVHFAAKSSAGPVALQGTADGHFLASAPLLAELPFSAQWILIPLCLIGFFLVWIVSHAINVLIILSPFGIVDAALKFMRLALLTLMAGLYAISPVLAAVLSGIIIVIAAFLAPSAFRLCVFGTFMGTDYLRSMIWKEKTPTSVRGFLAKRGSVTLKARSWGKLDRDETGKVKFVSRFFFFGHRRKLKLSHPEDLVVAKGFLFPSILRRDPETGKQHFVVYLLPRHRHHVEDVAADLGIDEVKETALARGYLAMKGWVVDTFRAGKTKLLPGDDSPT